MPTVSLAYLVGNVVVQQLPVVLDVRWLLTATLIAGLPRWRGRAWLVVALAAATWTSFVATGRLANRLPHELSPVDVELVGWVDSFPSIDSERAVMTMRVVESDHPAIVGRVRLSWYDAPEHLRPGTGLEVSVRLRSPRGLANPDGFDYERWLFLERVNATGYVRAGVIRPQMRFGFAQSWLKLRARIAERIFEGMERRAAALVVALAIGQRDAFGDDEWTTLRHTGTSHLVAISGMHVGLVAAFAFALALRFGLLLPYSAARFAINGAATTALVVAAIYSGLAGFALSTERALLMLLVAKLVLVSRRRVVPMHGFTVAMVVILICNPTATLETAFWLSFGAVALILTHGSSAARPAPDRGRLAGAIRLVSVLQLRITLGLAPLLLIYFGELSLIALPVNFLAIPFFSLIMVPASLLAAISALFGGSFGFSTVDLLATQSWRALDWFGSLDFAIFARAAPDPLTSALGLVGVILFALARRLRWQLCAIAALLPLAIETESRPGRGDFEMTVFDVGHGLSVLIETRAHRLLFDTGPVFRSGFDIGQQIVVPALKRSSSRPLDLIVVSHGDSDHAGGTAAVRAAYPSTPLLVGPDYDRYPLARRCRRGQRWDWDGVRFSVLHPDSDFERRGNDSSCVLRVEANDSSVLLTGDIERYAELELLGEPGVAADIVLVPHHGSATSSTGPFVEAVAARYAIVSVGYDNRWGFPRPDVRKRWEDSGAELVVTADSGALTFRSNLPGRVRRFRSEHRRYWHAPIFPGT